MKSSVTLRIAASTLIVGCTMVSCKSAAVRPASASAVAPDPAKSAAKLYLKAQAEVQQGRLGDALTIAEQVVELDPRDAGYRMLLADLYLKNGRFVSAESAYSHVLMLDPENSRAALTRALTMIGQGKQGEALIELDRLATTASPANVGLAFALAGQAKRAVEMLEPAARSPEANARIRQNLALAYALSGDWQKARVVAAQDLSPDQVGARLEQWAALANPGDPGSQVAAVLGVSPVADAGQPARLALAQPVAEPATSAQAMPVETPSVAPVAVGGPEGATGPANEQASVYQTPQHGDLFAEPARSGSAELPLPAAPKDQELVARANLVAAVDSLVSEPVKAGRPAVPVSRAPIMAFTPERVVAKSRVSAKGRYVVQIGAYRSAVQVEQAWARAYKQYDFGGNGPMSTTVAIPGKGTFHRLAVSGFQKPAEAARLCQSIRSRGGACFVRATAGDAPVQWASRYTRRA